MTLPLLLLKLEPHKFCGRRAVLLFFFFFYHEVTSICMYVNNPADFLFKTTGLGYLMFSEHLLK